MKHKLSYSLLLSLVVLFSVNVAHAQNVTIVGPTPAAPFGLEPNTVYCYDVVVDDLDGFTAFTIPVSVSGAGFTSGSITMMPGTVPGVVWNVVGDDVLLGYVGPAMGAGPWVVATICVTTTDVCGEHVVIAAGNMPPAGTQQFGGPPPLCCAAGTFTGIDDLLYDGIPVCGQNDDENLACGDAVVDKQINASDPIGLSLTYTQIAGVGVTTATGVYNYTPNGDECDFTSLVEVEVMNPCGNADTCSFSVIYDQAAPVITCPPAQTFHWALGAQVFCASATDDDCPTPHNLTWSITDAQPPPTNGIVIDQQGCITFDPDCLDIALSPITVTVRVHDGCEYDECDFTITVTDTAPWINCPPDVPMWYSHDGEMVLPFTAGDADSDPISVTILGATRNGIPDTPFQPMSIQGTYEFHWDPDWIDEGTWVITLEVDDGCQQTTCDFEVIVLGKFLVSLTDTTKVLPGYNGTVTLTVTNTMEVGGFDYLISYDPSGMWFLSAKAVGILESWEYFTYRYSEQDNCGGGCPTGLIRLIGIADMPNSEYPGDGAFHPEGDIVELTFGTSSDFDFIGQCFHLSFAWYDCGDNTMSSRTGDTLFLAHVYDSIPLPAYLPDLGCLDGDKGYVPLPRINFDGGIICIVPPEDDRGDINLNGVANEISDAVLFANYFIHGPEVLGYPDDPYWENRRLATDINDDGVPLTVADLVYLIRIITGDANPYPESGEGGKIAPLAGQANVSYLVGDKTVVRSQSLVDVGAAAFIFRHTGLEVGAPVLSDDISHMKIGSSDRDGELRILVYSMDNKSISQGAHDLFTIPTTGAGAIELVEVQYSDAKGNVLAVNMAKVAPPESFALLQNYPNPFNAGTVIRFALPLTSDWSLRVYNVAGQLVKEFKGRSEAGIVNVHWDAANAASGIYFYKLTAGDFADTKKMILMK